MTSRGAARWCRSAIVLVVVGAIAVTTRPAPAQTPPMARVMREKLTHSQKILEALMTSDSQGLDRESAALMKLTELPAWSVLKSPEYLRQSAAFLRALQDLRDAAKANDLEGAAMDYVSLTLTCFRCHRYVKGMRIAGR